MRHIISVLLENEAGALSRVSGLFSARGFNIESLVVAPTHDKSLSKLTLVTIGDDNIIEQIVKQLEKLIDTVSVVDLTKNKHIERELALVKLTSNSKKLLDLIKVFSETMSARIINEKNDNYIVELSGTSAQVDAFLTALNADDIIELSRTGVTGTSL